MNLNGIVKSLKSKNNLIIILVSLLVICLSIIPRFPYLNDISWWWRSGQTFMTSLWFEKEGISLLNYQTPIYGYPWQIPFEFPLYQALGVIITNIGSFLNVFHTLKSGMHITSLICFYASAIFLILLCWEYFRDRILILIILIIYLWLPYNIQYSTEILIDYLAVAFALGYLFFFTKWIDSPTHFGNVIWGTIFGIFGCLVKITTMGIVIIPIILMICKVIKEQNLRLDFSLFRRENIKKIVTNKSLQFLFIGSILIPICITMVWTIHSDAIKNANIQTMWLASSNLSSWNYGTFAQKTSFSNWVEWFLKIREFFLFGPLIVFPFIGIVFLKKQSTKWQDFFCSTILSPLLTIFIFFNLFLHDYYYIAISPFMSVSIGVGIFYSIKYIISQNKWFLVFFLIIAGFIIMQSYEKIKIMQQDTESSVSKFEIQTIPLAKRVMELTPENEYVISIQEDWKPNFLLYTERKGLIYTPLEKDKNICNIIDGIHYSTVVGPENSTDFDVILQCFKYSEMIEPGIYKVSN
ncbi:MAG: hypothetical protein AB2L18_09340 [Anaerolineaceae bacterium]